jgi:hypothetical protein
VDTPGTSDWEVVVPSSSGTPVVKGDPRGDSERFREGGRCVLPDSGVATVESDTVLWKRIRWR